ncbi:hypothetical protein Nepgr_012991 [Nepenthes gracilis]|uniref:Uncharacterized protein n=1 Tax=Nepenthes gracilis TaxID=150966 RepID=A0AAD3SGP9_NEPGR|nr:hypothetical protein Nepgr_012991 [Nepenthes gracilis]
MQLAKQREDEIRGLKMSFRKNAEAYPCIVVKLKSFCEEDEMERLTAQIMLLETLDWKLIHDSDPSTIQTEGHHNPEQTSKEQVSWEASNSKENEFLYCRLFKTRQKWVYSSGSWTLCVEEKQKLERCIKDLETQNRLCTLRKQRLSLGEVNSHESKKRRSS